MYENSICELNMMEIQYVGGGTKDQQQIGPAASKAISVVCGIIGSLLTCNFFNPVTTIDFVIDCFLTIGFGAVIAYYVYWSIQHPPAKRQ